VEDLADVLRRTLQRSTAVLQTVADEVDYVKSYLALEQRRFGDRLRVEWTVSGDTLGAPLPAMTLQPLVENALRHGIASRIEGGTLAIRVDRRDSKLRVTVADSGPGFPPHAREGTGLGNLRERLTTLYGAAATLRVEPSETGALVSVEVPSNGPVGAMT
jgi:two-component system LytT family sensor kinase